MFEVKYSKKAIKFLKSAEKVLVKRILEKIEELQKDPFLHDTKSIQGYTEKLFRVRIGDYRILYEIDYQGKIIGVVKIDKRSKVYE